MGTTASHASPTIAVGDICVTALLDVDLAFPLPIEQVFTNVDAEEWEVHRARYPGAFSADGGWRYVVTCYLLQEGDRRVLVDTGCGAAALAFPAFLGVEGRLAARLSALGVSRDQIDTVVITHIHPDHVGGFVAPDRHSRRPPSPAPASSCRARDWETWRRPDVQEAFPFPYVGDTIAPLIDSGDVELFEGERSLSRGLTLLPTPGHTPGSSSLLIDSGGERAMLVGDGGSTPSR